MSAVRNLRKLVLRILPHQVVGWLRTWKLRRSITRFQPRWVSHQYGMEFLTVRIEDGLGQGWYDNDWDELPEIAFLASRQLVPGALVFDLGAHQGVVAMMLAAKVRPTGSVVAVEANSHNARIANLNLERNGVSNVKVIHAAISNTVGEIVLNMGLNSQVDDGTGSWGQQTVPALTIDHLAIDHGMPDVVFIDIEGAEWLALQGAGNVSQHCKNFFVEVHVKCGLEKLGGSVESVLDFFKSRGFDVCVRRDVPESFRVLQDSDPILKERFFLIACKS